MRVIRERTRAAQPTRCTGGRLGLVAVAKAAGIGSSAATSGAPISGASPAGASTGGGSTTGGAARASSSARAAFAFSISSRMATGSSCRVEFGDPARRVVSHQFHSWIGLSGCAVGSGRFGIGASAAGGGSAGGAGGGAGRLSSSSFRKGASAWSSGIVKAPASTSVGPALVATAETSCSCSSVNSRPATELVRRTTPAPAPASESGAARSARGWRASCPPSLSS